jgi:DNA processing protein
VSTPEDFAAWFRLLETPGLGRDSARRLLAAFGSPSAALSASRKALGSVVSASVADGLGAEPPDFAIRWAVAQAWLAGGPDRHVLTLGDPNWPPLLLQSADPPSLLYVQGRVGALSAPSVAVVGSRQPTAQGLDNARAFAAGIGRKGYAIVSGLALGIDGAAHEGALDSGAETVAVVGTGLDRCYPARHATLALRVAAQGALVSEYAPGTPPLAEHFPQRNRIIAALSRGTLVVEAALRSGSLITARMALEAGRDVYAIPGSIHAAQSRGCHSLIKQGAKLVESAEDVLEELQGAGPSRQAAAPADPAEASADGPDPLLEALGEDPVTLDALMARTGWPAAELSARLLDLELDGRASRLPGGLYQQRHSS